VDLSTNASQDLAWLYGVAANVLRNQWRTQRRYRAALARLPRAGYEDDVAQAAADRLDDQARMKRLTKQLHVLPTIDQEVLSLCAWEDLSPREAAVALGIPEATVRTRLHRARKRLRTLDEGNGGTSITGVPRIGGEGS
jgi:RNA polymerase sigma-70 factor (ECF subfamily)